MIPTSRGIALEAEATTLILSASVTAAYGSAGSPLASSIDSISVLIANVGSFAFEYQVASGPWKKLGVSQVATELINLSTTQLNLRKGEFANNGQAEFAVEYLTGNVLTDDQAGAGGVPLTGQDLIGLGNVDNTSDAAKPVSGPQRTAIDAAQAAAVVAANAALSTHSANIANPHAVTKAQVGLGSADNTADSAKPVSGPQQTALDLKLDRAGGTLTGALVLAGDAVSALNPITKQQFDTLISGFGTKYARARTTGALPANTYNNGTSGVGATLTGNSNGALPAQDGVTLIVGDFLAVGDEASGLKNGLYQVTQVGSGGTPYILTRVVGMDQSSEFAGVVIVVTEGSTLLGKQYFSSFSGGSFTVGTTALTWVLASGTASSTDVVSEGSNNKYFTNARAIAAPLTSLDTGAANVVIAASDSTLQAFGKIRTRLEAAVSGLATELTTRAAADTSLTGSLGAKADTSTVVNDITSAVNDAIALLTNRPSANVVMANGKTLEVVYQEILIKLAGISPTAPIVTAAPAIAGTVTVGNTLTATFGAVTEGTGGTHTTQWQWLQTNPSTGVTTPITGANGTSGVGVTTAQLALNAALFGYRISFSQVPVDSTGAQGAAKSSVLTAAVGGTVPANSVAPSWSPSGSQSLATTVTLSMNTWTGMSGGIFEIQLYDNGSPFGSPIRQAAAVTTYPYTGINTQAGHTITATVVGESSLGVRSAPVPTSNNVVFTGSQAVANTVLPVAPAHWYMEVQSAFTQGTWTGAINAQRTWNIWKTAVGQGGVALRTGNLQALFTPKANDGVVVGDLIFIEEVVVETATSQTYKAVSVSKATEATPTALTVVVQNASVVAIQSSPLSAVIPVLGQGGTGTLTYSISPPVPAGLVYNTSTGTLSGTSGSLYTQTTHTVTVTDSATPTPAQATGQFTLAVNAASVTPLPALVFPVPTDIAPNGSTTYSDGNTITVASVVRLQRVSDPGGSGTLVYLFRMVATDHSGGTTCRVEWVWIDFDTTPYYYMVPGNEYWMAFAVRTKGGEYPTSNGGQSDNNHLVWQLHSESVGDSQPDLALFHDIGGNRSYIQRAWNATPDADDTGANTSKDWIGAYPTSDTWYKYVIRFKPGYNSGQAPLTQAWLQVGAASSWTMIIDKTASTDLNTHAVQGSEKGSYPRLGFYKWGGTQWPSPSTIAGYLSKHFWVKGTNQFSAATAAMAPFNT